MKHEYSIHIEDNILTETFTGDIDLSILDQANASIIKDKNFVKGLNFLTDLREANLLITYDEMWQHTYRLPDLGINKLAIITNRDLEYGISRQFEALTNDKDLYIEISIFKDRNEALKWLKL